MWSSREAHRRYSRPGCRQTARHSKATAPRGWHRPRLRARFRRCGARCESACLHALEHVIHDAGGGAGQRLARRRARDIPGLVVMLDHVGNSLDRNERAADALAQFYSERIPPEELLRADADHPAADLVYPAGVDTAELGVVRPADPFLVDLVVVRLDLLYLVAHALMLFLLSGSSWAVEVMRALIFWAAARRRRRWCRRFHLAAAGDLVARLGLRHEDGPLAGCTRLTPACAACGGALPHGRDTVPE
jgi:hypothetical protein